MPPFECFHHSFFSPGDVDFVFQCQSIDVLDNGYKGKGEAIPVRGREGP
jgi:hypothetical protein